MFLKFVSLLRMTRSGLTFALLSALSTVLYAQEVFTPRPSPLALATMRYKDAYVKVTYSQPQKKGRKIFGDLVPFGQVWRTGANEATEITLTYDMMINDQLIKAGTYSLFTIPQPDEWTVILNTDLGLWGSYNYNSKFDLARFQVPVAQNDVIFEAFTIIFEQRNEMADLLIMWDDVKVSLPLKFIN